MTRGSPLPPSPFRRPPAPQSFVPVTPLFRLLFHGRAEVSFLNYERTTPVGCLLYEKRRVKLVVVPHRRQRAGPVSYASSRPLPYGALTNLRARSALHSCRIHPEEHANDFIITKRASRGRDHPFGSRASHRPARSRPRPRPRVRVRVPFIPYFPVNLLIYDTIEKINPQDVT